MIVKNSKTYYDDTDLRLYGQGYWDGRFHGYESGSAFDKTYAYKLGFQHGEADYLENDAVSEEIIFDDLDVVEQIRNHPQEPTQTC